MPLYDGLEDSFDRSYGTLDKYFTSGPDLPSRHSDIRLFTDEDNLQIPWTMQDMNFWNSFHFDGMVQDSATTESLAGHIDSSQNEDWAGADISVTRDSTYRYANTLAATLTGTNTLNFLSLGQDDLYTDYEGGAFIELVFRNLPAQSVSPHLDLANSYIDFSSVDNFAPNATDSIRLNESLHDMTAGGDTYFRINRDRLTTVDLTDIKGVRFRLKATGSMTVKMQALRLIAADYIFPLIDTNTKLGALTRTVRQQGGTEPSTPWGTLYFDEVRPRNVTMIVRFNTGHNPTGNDNIVRVYLRHNYVNDSRIQVDLLARNTQSRLRIYETQQSVTTEIYSTPINTNILQENEDYVLKVELDQNTIIASIYMGGMTAEVEATTYLANTSTLSPIGQGVIGLPFAPYDSSYVPPVDNSSFRSIYTFLGTLLYTTGSRTVSSVARGYVGYSFEPYNYDFILEYVKATKANFSRFESTPFASVTPVRAATLFTQASDPADLTEGVTYLASGDGISTAGTIGQPGPSDLVTRDGLTWYGGLQSDTTVFIGDSKEVFVTGDIYVLNQVRGKYRVALVDRRGGVGFIGYMSNLRPNQWNSFRVTLRGEILPDDYLVLIHQTGFYGDKFYVDNLKLNHYTLSWEASPDTGSTWQRFYEAINLDYSSVYFPIKTTSVQIKATALDESAWISSYQMLPRYADIGATIMPFLSQGAQAARITGYYRTDAKSMDVRITATAAPTSATDQAVKITGV